MYTDVSEQNTISMAGEWSFALDIGRSGIENEFYSGDLPETVTLPGTTDSNNKGIGKETPNYRNLNRRNMYMGWAWYKKDIVIPDNFSGKHIELFLERCLWETRIWIDTSYAGSCDSLAAPHIYDVTDFLTPGRHSITIMVDNSNLKAAGKSDIDTSSARDLTSGKSEVRKHNCGGHHTAFLMPTNWNGIIGKIELRAMPKIRLEKADIYPRKNLCMADFKLCFANGEKACGNGSLLIEFKSVSGKTAFIYRKEILLSGSEIQQESFTLEMPETIAVWNEFNPTVYNVKFTFAFLKETSALTLPFGLRYIEAKGHELLLNGNRVFLRGSVENCTFPLTFAPPTDIGQWERIFSIAKSYGLNHLRFHSFCPPEAAFTAADNAGFLLQIELPGSSCPDEPEDPNDTDFLQRELKRILDTYGNHPSFGMLSMGNEQLVMVSDKSLLEQHGKMLGGKVQFGQKYDPRHLYTATSHPCSPGRKDDYFVSAWTMKGFKAMCEGAKDFAWDCFTTGIQWGGPDPMSTCYYCVKPPTLNHDYDTGLNGIEKPFISHEVGQWEVFPNVNETAKYTGVLEPGNLNLIKDDLEKKGLLPLVPEFVRASGKLSLMLYRDEIETMLKSNELSGFQLLDLTDYPGQGTSTVGILDAFWDSKGLITPQKFKSFCSSAVLLLRTEKRVYTSGETITATAQVANYRLSSYKLKYTFTITDGESVLFTAEKSAIADCGATGTIGEFSYKIPEWDDAHKLTVTLKSDSMKLTNSWELWVYPEKAKIDKNIIVTQWDGETIKRLENGESLILLPENYPDDIKGVFTPVFWNPQMKKQTGTFGILCDPKHPMLKGFETEEYTQWQWWDILKDSSVMDISKLKVSPSVRIIDSFMTNRSLALIVEANVANGKLIICTAKLCKDAQCKPAARWLLHCLCEYVKGKEFKPQNTLYVGELDELLKRKAVIKENI